ncbi:hypothetical protein LTR37_002831 [Vermiconidia calcicola]|uniref:Uncharacterized protein n=1 Tax=Vermiconidia calcicola TaxID=1690605 RepID=A0ACC3NRV7_9PEZI|nr:hypothetical protein LTR37_002831 [Vermiconidia calcicola]
MNVALEQAAKDGEAAKHGDGDGAGQIGGSTNPTRTIEASLDAGERHGGMVEKASLPERGAVSPIAQQIVAALTNIWKNSHRDRDVETAREMRFALRLILSKWRDSISRGFQDKAAFEGGALRVVDPGNENVMDARGLTARALANVLARAPWATRSDETPTRSPDGQPKLACNSTMRDVQSGIKIVLDKLNRCLEVDGSEDREFSDAEMSEDETAMRSGKPSARSKKEAKSDSQMDVLWNPPEKTRISRHSTAKWHDWTTEEDAILATVHHDHPEMNVPEKMAEHNRRMADYRTRNGLAQERDRTYFSIRQRLSKILSTGGNREARSRKERGEIDGEG